MECPECSRKIPEDARYCAYCAAPVGGCSGESKNPTAGSSVSGQPAPSGGEPADQSLGETPTLKEAPGPDRDLSLGEEATMVSGPGEGIVEEKEIGSRYRVEEVLGQGGMGVVYRCRDGKLDREVAVKRLLAKEKASRAGLERFLREARTIAGLNHRNIVQVHDIGEDANGSYIVMEYIRCGTLKNRMRESGKLDRTEVLKLARQIGQGLAYAHRKGVIHRDIKPANIFIDEEGVCKVGDFGLARFGTESELSMTGYGMGTLDYMPPEQRRDAKHADHRADIYSFGATLYELVTGKSPRTVRESELPGELRVTVLKAMEERPEDRYFSVMELLEDLEKGGGKKPVPLSVVTTEKGKCPSCGNNNELSSKYCESCGVGLFGKCPKCSEEIRLGLKHCPKCGVEVEKREQFNSHIERGDKYTGEGKFSRALKEYEEALELAPGDESVEGKIAAVKENRERVDNLQKEAAEARTGKAYERERELLGEVLKIVPSSKEARTRLGEIEGDIINDTVSKLMKKSVEARTGKNYERERELLGEVLKIVPSSKEARTRLGEIEGDIINDTVSKLMKKSVEARTGKNYERERELLDEVLKIAPGREEVISRLGDIDRDIELLFISMENDLDGFIRVKPGLFLMGSNVDIAAASPAHQVSIKRDFFIGKYPVTQGLYTKVMGVNPSRFKGEDHPVEQVNWHDALEFCRKATELLKQDGKIPEGWEVRLPTEAEWEYACRAGTETPYYWGSEFDGDYCWYYGNTRRGGIFSGRSTRPVGQKKPNAWGIYDMIGNVWEWCRSLYREYPYREDDGREDLKANGFRVLRGGSWNSIPRSCRSAYINCDHPGCSFDIFGFRVVLAGR